MIDRELDEKVKKDQFAPPSGAGKNVRRTVLLAAPYRVFNKFTRSPKIKSRRT